MTIEKLPGHDEDFDCMVSDLDDLLLVLIEIKAKRGNILVGTYEHPTIQLYVNNEGMISIS